VNRAQRSSTTRCSIRGSGSSIGCGGDAALGYHVANITLHGTVALLFALVLRQLAVRGAWLAALVFALPPDARRVHSLGSASRRTTLSVVFYLAAALAHLRFDASRSASAYRAALLCFIAALLTKSVVATAAGGPPRSALVETRPALVARRRAAAGAVVCAGGRRGLFTAPWSESSSAPRASPSI